MKMVEGASLVLALIHAGEQRAKSEEMRAKGKGQRAKIKGKG